MSEIVQAKWSRRLENWALWLVSGGAAGGNASPYPAYRDYVPSRRFWSSPPLPQAIGGDAIDTDSLLARLACGRQGAEQYAAIRAWYLWTGSTVDRAKALGIHPDTLHDRLRAARNRLEDLELARRRSMAKPPSNTPTILAMTI